MNSILKIVIINAILITKALTEGDDDIVCDGKASDKLDESFMRLGMFGDPNARYPTNEEELKQQCLIENELIEWSNSYSAKCLADKPVSQTAAELTLKGIAKQVERFCGAAKHSKEYISWSKCGNYVLNDTVKCWNGFTLDVERIKFVKETIPQDDRVPLLCCDYYKFHHCMVVAY